jgi:hypothetical protein
MTFETVKKGRRKKEKRPVNKIEKSGKKSLKSMYNTCTSTEE